MTARCTRWRQMAPAVVGDCAALLLRAPCSKPAASTPTSTCPHAACHADCVPGAYSDCSSGACVCTRCPAGRWCGGGRNAEAAAGRAAATPCGAGRTTKAGTAARSQAQCGERAATVHCRNMRTVASNWPRKRVLTYPPPAAATSAAAAADTPAYALPQCSFRDGGGPAVQQQNRRRARAAVTTPAAAPTAPPASSAPLAQRRCRKARRPSSIVVRKMADRSSSTHGTHRRQH